MATIISIKLDKRICKKDGTYPICLSLNWAGSKSYINLGRSVGDKYWSAEFGRLTKGSTVQPSPAVWNDWMQEKLALAQDIIDREAEAGTLANLSHRELKNMIRSGRSSVQNVSFSIYLDNLIRQFKENNKDGQARIYTQAKNFLTRYGDKESGVYEFYDINYRLLRLMEERYVPRKAGNLNGIGVVLRTLRAVWNRAINEGVADETKYPFKKYKIKKSKTHKSAITRENIESIAKLSLPVASKQWHGRNMFLFSFMCRGMNFADIATLRWDNIQAGRIIYVRGKIHKQQNIAITDPIQQILDLYPRSEHNLTGYIFPVVFKNQGSANLQARRSLSVINHALKRWAKALGIDQSLSFNTARHSWATIARNMNLPIAVISQGLGHNATETTQIYLDEFDTSVIDQATAIVSMGLRQT